MQAHGIRRISHCHACWTCCWRYPLICFLSALAYFPTTSPSQQQTAPHQVKGDTVKKRSKLKVSLYRQACEKVGAVPLPPGWNMRISRAHGQVLVPATPPPCRYLGVHVLCCREAQHEDVNFAVLLHGDGREAVVASPAAATCIFT